VVSCVSSPLLASISVDFSGEMNCWMGTSGFYRSWGSMWASSFCYRRRPYVSAFVLLFTEVLVRKMCSDWGLICLPSDCALLRTAIKSSSTSMCSLCRLLPSETC
jgi:hypothetical protein